MAAILRPLLVNRFVQAGQVAVLDWRLMRQPARFAMAEQLEKVRPVNVASTRVSWSRSQNRSSVYMPM
jgi:hypothetical protein